MTIFASQGCAACHRLQGFESNVGFAVEKDRTTFEKLYDEQLWFKKLFPEVDPFFTGMIQNCLVQKLSPPSIFMPKKSMIRLSIMFGKIVFWKNSINRIQNFSNRSTLPSVTHSAPRILNIELLLQKKKIRKKSVNS